MEAWVSYALIFVSSVLALPVLVFVSEIIAGAAFSRTSCEANFGTGSRPRIAVLIPAHNESSGILRTLSDLRSQLQVGDTLLVVADNCSDDTAAVARAAGAIVVERTDLSRRGKGYALDYGLRHLSSDPPQIVIIIDADCRLLDGTINTLAINCEKTGRPVQGLYLMTSAADNPINHRVAEFSWRVKNWIRPLGLLAFQLPCQLMGTGMAFPWNVITSMELGTPQIVEDLKLGLDLTLAGHPPLFCPSARLTSEFPSSMTGTKTQRKRWEQGHIQTIVTLAPRLIAIAVSTGNRDLLAVALDLAVPPLSLLAVLVLMSFGLSLLDFLLSGSFAALCISSTNVLVFSLATLIGWTACGRDVVPLNSALMIPAYAVRKLGLYCQIALGQLDSHWIRTDRKSDR